MRTKNVVVGWWVNYRCGIGRFHESIDWAGAQAAARDYEQKLTEYATSWSSFGTIQDYELNVSRVQRETT